MNDSYTTAIVAFMGIYMIVALLIAIFTIVCMWKVFTKAGQPGWASLIPFYNIYVTFEIAWGNGLLFLLMLIVRRHIMGGANRTLISALLPPRLRSRVGNRKLSAGQPHAVAALLEKQESCF